MSKTAKDIQEEICGKCIHYFYIDGKKIFSGQQRVCQREGGQCKKLLSEAIKLGYEKEKPKTYDDIEKGCPNKQIKRLIRGAETICILTNKVCCSSFCPKINKEN